MSIVGWKGAGYIVLDPDTGAGAYLISGGKNGGILKDMEKGLGKVLSVLSAFEKSLGKLGAGAKILKNAISKVKKFVQNMKSIIDIAMACNPGFALLGIVLYLFQMWVAYTIMAAAFTTVGVLSAGCGVAAPVCAIAGGVLAASFIVDGLNASLQGTSNYIVEGCSGS